MLNDREIAIITTKSMLLSESDALEYLRGKGFDIKRSTYYSTLGHISSETRKRAFEYAKVFLEDHIYVIDELLSIKKMMYDNADKCEDELKSTMILAKIVDTIIPYISAYKEATKDIIMEEVKNKIGKEESVSLSALGI